MKSDINTEMIIRWRESLTLLPDEQFFNLIRMYLGEIKTPFNKQKVIESLSSFLRKAENQERIAMMLSELELKLVTAVFYLSDCDINKLTKMFAVEVSGVHLYEVILNLQERLVLFTYTDKFTDKKIIAINPLVQKALEPYLSLKNLIYTEEGISFQRSPLLITDELITMFTAYVNLNPGLCKASLDFKKKTVLELEEIFGNERLPVLRLVFNGLLNLSVFNEKDEKISVDFHMLKKFASLNRESRFAYICAAGAAHFALSTITTSAQLLLDVIHYAGESVYRRNIFVMLSYLVKEFSGSNEGFKPGRFSMLLAQADKDLKKENFNTSIFDQILEGAVTCGILNSVCRKDGEYISVSPEYRAYMRMSSPAGKVCCLNIDAGFAVNLMPGLDFSSQYNLSRFLVPVRYDTVSRLELTKKSVLKALDTGFSAEEIFSVFNENGSFQIPQNVRVSVEEWNTAFSAVSVYKGYVLRVSNENIPLVEKNPSLKELIAETLAPGIYFLNIREDSDPSVILMQAGLGDCGEVIVPSRRVRSEGFKILSASRQIVLDKEAMEKKPVVCNSQTQENFMKEMKKNLLNMELTQEQKDGLEERIERKIVINEEQLRPESVRFELMEAGGMDFIGKMHIIESAIESKSLIQIELTGNEGYIIGFPFNLIKKGAESQVEIYKAFSDEKEILSVLVAAAARIKKLHGTALAFS